MSMPPSSAPETDASTYTAGHKRWNPKRCVCCCDALVRFGWPLAPSARGLCCGGSFGTILSGLWARQYNVTSTIVLSGDHSECHEALAASTRFGEMQSGYGVGHSTR